MPPAINPATFLPLFMPAPEFGFSWIWNAWAPGGKPVKFGVTIMPWWLSFNAIVLISVPTPSAEILLTETVTSLASAGVTPIKNRGKSTRDDLTHNILDFPYHDIIKIMIMSVYTPTISQNFLRED